MSINLAGILESLKTRANKRFEDFEVVDSDSIQNIQEESYLLKPKRLGGDTKYTIAMVDLNGSTELSLKKYKKTIAKLYDYFTQSAFDCFNSVGFADYIDIKGDGVFAIFEGKNQLERAFIAITTFRKFFHENINSKFSQYGEFLTCKCAIYQDTLLVRRLGNTKYKNEVRAGRLVTLCSKVISYPKENLAYPQKNSSYLVVSDNIYNYYKDYYEEYITNSCGCNGDKTNLRKEFSLSNDFKFKYDIKFDKIHILDSLRCDSCGQNYIDNILSI